MPASRAERARYAPRAMFERMGQLFRGNEPVAIAVELAAIWLAVFVVLRFLRGTRGIRPDFKDF